MTEALTLPRSSNCTPLKNATSSPPRMLRSNTSISGKPRAGCLPQLPARAGKLAQSGFDGIDPAGDVEVHGIGRVQGALASKVAIMGMCEDTP